MIFNEKYENLFDIHNFPNVRYAIVVGSRASGKSTVVSHLTHDLSFNSDHVILSTRFTMTSAKDSVIAEMEKTMDERDSIEFFEQVNNSINNTYSKSKIIFKGLKAGSKAQTAKLKSITDLNIWLLDEAEELQDESVFDDIDDSIRRKDYQNLVILVLNSHHITKEHFIYKRFFSDMGVNWMFNGIKENVLYIHTNVYDNWINLSDSFKLKVNQTKEKYKKKFDYNFLGKIRDKSEGVILDNWSYGEFDNNLPFNYGMDFGVSDPDAVVKCAVDKKRKLIYWKEELYKNNLGTDDLDKELKEFYIYNKLIKAENASPRTIKDLKSKGYNIQAVSKNKIVEDIKVLKDYHIIVDPSSLNLGSELNKWVWLDKKGDVPLDDFNHLIDAGRYGTMLHIQPQRKTGMKFY